MNTLCALVTQLGKKYCLFIKMVDTVLKRNRVSHQRYEILITKIIRGSTVADDEDDPMMCQNRNRPYRPAQQQIPQPSMEAKKNSVTISELQVSLRTFIL